MHILITGGTGLIGKALIQEILQQINHVQLTVLTRNIAKASSMFPTVVHKINQLKDIHLGEVDVVINLAGEPIVNKRWSKRQKDVLCHSRWDLTLDIVKKINTECSSERKLRFISGSAVGIYGRQDDQTITEEFIQYYPEFTHHLCQKWEEIANQANNSNTVLLRTGIVLSDEGGALKKMLLPFKLGLGGKIADGNQYMPWIHIEDMVAAIIHLLTNQGINGPVNLTAPNSVTNTVFANTLAQTLGRPALFPLPEFVLRFLMGEMADILVFGQNVYPNKLLESGFTFKFEKLPDAMADLLLKK